MSLPGVKIGDYHCETDWGCYLASKTIGSPEVVTNLVQVPGRDGCIDLTDYLKGRSTYGNRTISIELILNKPYTEWPSINSEISNDIHGKKLKIIFDDDPKFAYSGRCSVEYKPVTKYKEKIEITADCEPFKWGYDRYYCHTTLTMNSDGAVSKTVDLTGAGDFCVCRPYYYAPAVPYNMKNVHIDFCDSTHESNQNVSYITTTERNNVKEMDWITLDLDVYTINFIRDSISEIDDGVPITVYFRKGKI